jgi:hypothetical protein
MPVCDLLISCPERKNLTSENAVLQSSCRSGDHPVHAHEGCSRTNEKPLLWPDAFTYLPESNSYVCPAGQQLNYGGHSKGNRTFGYIGTRKKCGPCQLIFRLTRRRLHRRISLIPP